MSRNGNAKSKSPKAKKSKAIRIQDEAVGEFYKNFLALLAPKEFIPPSEWQERYRVAPPGDPKPGRWHNYPFQIEPLDSFADETISSLCLMWASQLLGKTAIEIGGMMWMIDQNPGTGIGVFPTDGFTNKFVKTKFNPAIRQCPRVKDLITSSVEKGDNLGSGGNTLQEKHYPGGWFKMGGSNSSTNLASDAARWTVFDEVDKYPESAGDEGDTIFQARQRSATYPDAFSVITSTPTFAELSRIEKEFAESDQRKWFVTCEACKEEFLIFWHHIKWTKSVSPEGKKIHNIWDAYLECPVCGAKHDEQARVRMVWNGRWVVTNTDPAAVTKRGYWLNAFNVLLPCNKRGFKNWMHWFASEFLAAERLGPEGVKTWVNLKCAETFELETTPPPEHFEIFNRREELPEHEGEVIIPERCLLLTWGADVQAIGEIHVEILGHGINDETWGIAYKIFKGNVETPDIFNEVDEWVRRKWRHASGYMIWAAAGCIDSGNKPTQIYEYVRRVRRAYVYAIKGDRGYTAHWVVRSGKKDVPLQILKVDGPKERLYSQLKITEYGAGFQHFPSNLSSGYDEEYFRQLTAEKMVHGTKAPYFVPISGRPNHALDTRIYALAAKEVLPMINWGKIQSGFSTPAYNDWRIGTPFEPNKPPPEPEPEPSGLQIPDNLLPPKPAPAVPGRPTVRVRRGSGLVY